MVAPKKRLEQKKKQDKIESLNKKIRSMKQQVGRFKKGKMVLKKKGGKTLKDIKGKNLEKVVIKSKNTNQKGDKFFEELKMRRMMGNK